MAIEGLKIIAESINNSVPSTQKMFDADDIDGILELAKMQDERGGTYIDVNVGTRSAEFMGELIQKIQQVTSKPLSIDTPDFELAEAGLKAYDPALANGQKPILNSISQLRMEMLDLYKLQPYIPILLITERDDAGKCQPNHTAQETYDTAKEIVAAAREKIADLSNDDIILDPGISPIGSDSEGHFKRLMDSLKMLHDDSTFSGMHRSVGLSNFTVMLPPKKADGSPVKGPLESAFLTMAMPLGQDMVIGSVKRKYRLLEDDHPAMQCLKDVLNMEGFDVIQRVMMYYS